MRILLHIILIFTSVFAAIPAYAATQPAIYEQEDFSLVGKSAHSGALRKHVQLVNDTLEALSDPATCTRAFSSHEERILRAQNGSYLGFDNLVISNALPFAAGGMLAEYGYKVESMGLQSIARMVPLDHVSSKAIKATLVFHGKRTNNSDIGFKIGEVAFYFDKNNALTRCEARPYILVPNLFSLRESLEGGQTSEFLSALYNRNAGLAKNAVNGNTLDKGFVERGNMGWAVMDQLYPLGMIHLLNRHRELDKGPLTLNYNTLSAAKASMNAVAHFSDAASGSFDFSDWFMTPMTSDPEANGPDLLQGAQILQALSVGLDWYRFNLSSDYKKMLVRAIYKKGMKRFVDMYNSYAAGNPAPKSWWMKSPSNWNAVINGSLLVALRVISYEVDPTVTPQLAAKIQKLFHQITVSMKDGEPGSISYGLQALGPNGDGGWFEGPMYWEYAMTNLAAVANSFPLRDVFPGLNLNPESKFDAFRRTLNFALGVRNKDGRLYNFSDSGDGIRSFPPVFWFAKYLDRPDVTNFESRILAPQLTGGKLSSDYKKSSDFAYALDLAWINGSHLMKNTLSPQQRLYVFPVTNLGMVIDNASLSKMYLGMKGTVTDTAHRQQDAGNFVFEADGVRWAIDPGLDSYCLPDYSAGYIYFRQRPDGNNALSVAGEYLKAPVASPLSLVAANRNSVVTQVDLTQAYKEAAAIDERGKLGKRGSGVLAKRLLGMTRTFTAGMEEGNGYVLIDDFIQTEQGEDSLPELTWNMNVPGVKVIQSPSSIVLEMPSGKKLKVVINIENGVVNNVGVDVQRKNMDADGPILSINTWEKYKEGGYRLPNGMGRLQIKFTPNNDANGTHLKVYLIPQSSRLFYP